MFIRIYVHSYMRRGFLAVSEWQNKNVERCERSSILLVYVALVSTKRKRQKRWTYRSGLLSLVTRHVLYSNNWHASSCWLLLLKCQRILPNKQRIIIKKKDHGELNIMMSSDYRWHGIPRYLSRIMHCSRFPRIIPKTTALCCKIS